jgi:hypothetical protein
MQVYWSSVEFEYQESKEGLKGGFVYAFVNEIDAKHALDTILDELNKLKLKYKLIEFIKPYELELDWSTKKQTNHYKTLYKKASKSDGVIFDVFYSFVED